MIFGWLVCRGPRGIRGYSYYLNRYWRCVREVIGRPLSNPLTAAEAKDYHTLVTCPRHRLSALSTGPDQRTPTIPPSSPRTWSPAKPTAPDAGDMVDVFERMLTADTAVALLGPKRSPHIVKTRSSGSAAAGACAPSASDAAWRGRDRVRELVSCLRFYRRCLRQCFRPLVCDITGPKAASRKSRIQRLPGFLIPVPAPPAAPVLDHYSSSGRRTILCTTPRTSTIRRFLREPRRKATSRYSAGCSATSTPPCRIPGLHFIRLTVFSVTGAHVRPQDLLRAVEERRADPRCRRIFQSGQRSDRPRPRNSSRMCRRCARGRLRSPRSRSAAAFRSVAAPLSAAARTRASSSIRSTSSRASRPNGNARGGPSSGRWTTSRRHRIAGSTGGRTPRC